MIRCSTKSKEFKRLLEQRESHRLANLKLIEEQETRRHKELIKEEKQREVFESLKVDWRLELSPQEAIEQEQVIIEEIKVKVPEKLKSNWRDELYPKEIENQKELDIEEEIIEVSEHLKSNWRKELSEGMTTGGGEIQFAPTDIPLDTIDASDPASFTAANGGFDVTFPQDGLMGATIVSNGTGSGNNGGFNLGKSYLSFNGTGYDLSGAGYEGLDNTRAVILTPFDSTRATTLEITAIVGNGSNGGEAPGVDQDIVLWYTDPNGDFPNSLIQALDDENFQEIIAVPYNGSGSVRTYSVTIPSYLRKSGISFVLRQFQGSNPSLTGDNYGITEIKLKRTTPVSVAAPLDSPEAVSFFRVGTGPNVETPEQRYRRVMQQLLASKNYTTTKFGSNYPGSNFSGIRGVAQPPTWEQAAAQTEIQQTTANIQSSIDNFEKAFSDLKSELEKTPRSISQLMDKINSNQALTPQEIQMRNDYRAFTENRDSADNYLKMLSDMKSRGDKMYDYYSRPAMIAAHVDRSRAAAEKAEKAFIEKYGFSPSDKSTTPSLSASQVAKIDKQIADLKAAAKQSAIDAKNYELLAWSTSAAVVVVGTALIGELIASTAIASAAGGVASALRGLKTATDAAKAAASRSASRMGQDVKGRGMGDRWAGPISNSYEPQGEVISEKKTSKTLKSVNQALYPGQPSPNGFPDQDPPKQLPNGFHQDYGQRDSMYNTLDKTSATSMPPTGNPEIDKKVAKARKQPK